MAHGLSERRRQPANPGAQIQKRDWLTQLAEDAADLHSAAGDAVAEKLAQVLAADLAFTARALLDSATGPRDRWQCLRELLPELARFRHYDHRSQLLELSRRRSDRLSKPKPRPARPNPGSAPASSPGPRSNSSPIFWVRPPLP